MRSRRDGDLEARVQSALKDESSLRPYDLRAQVIGGVAHLQGIVDVLAEKIRAEELIRGIPGVTEVDNAVTVCTDGDIDDGDVEFEVSEELRADPGLKEIGATVRGGSVRLVGRVNTLADEARAIRTAATARGVREVQSELKIDEGWPHDDATVSNRIESALEAENRLKKAKIIPSVNRGVVTLKGFVARPEDMETALEIASGIEGVQSVRNRMSVSPDVESRVVSSILEEILADPFVREAPLSFSVVGGEIRVEGKVKSQQQKRRVERAVRQALHDHRGEVIGVDNKLMVTTD